MKLTKLSMLVAGAALIAAPFASALPTLYYDFGAAGIDGFDRDNVAGEDAPATVGTAGALIAGFTGGGWGIASTATTKPANGSPTNPQLGSTQLTVNGTGSITIYFAESGFGPSTKGFLAQLSATSLAQGSSIAYTTYATTVALETGLPGTLNLAALDAAHVLTATQTLSNAAGFSQLGGVLPAPLTGANPYNLIMKMVITQTGGSTQMTANLSNVPDGGTTLALLGASLLGMGAVRRKLTK